MDSAPLLYYFLPTASLLLLLFLLSKHLQLKGRKNYPPGPPSLPIIGHLHLIKEPIHRALQGLSDRYGPIFFISFGCRPVVVVSSPSAVEECFVKNDLAFAGRPNLEGWRELSYNFTTIGAATYGPLWRNLRRISTLEIFSTTRLQSFLTIRQDEQRSLVKRLCESSGGGDEFVKVEMKSRLKDLSFNVIMRMVSGKRFFGAEVELEDLEQAREFKDTISEVFEVSGASDPGDFVPLLRLVDFQGRRKRVKQIKRRLDVSMQRLIDGRRKMDKLGGGIDDGHKKTIIDSMVDLQASEPELYTDDIIKGVILVCISL